MSTNASHTNTTPGDIPGRWAISGTGLSNAILLDTATGATWHVNGRGTWVRMLHAEDFSGSLNKDDLRRSIDRYTDADLPRRATP